jgi:hypothetical protein
VINASSIAAQIAHRRRFRADAQFKTTQNKPITGMTIKKRLEKTVSLRVLLFLKHSAAAGEIKRAQIIFVLHHTSTHPGTQRRDLLGMTSGYSGFSSRSKRNPKAGQSFHNFQMASFQYESSGLAMTMNS